MLQVFVVLSVLLMVSGQRSPYAGSRPASGYKDTYLTQNPQGSTLTLANRFDGPTGVTGAFPSTSIPTSSSVPTSTQRLPYDAHGDQYIYDYWQSVPLDKRPFWVVNQAHIENQRGTPSGSTASALPTSSSTLAGTLGSRLGETTFNNPNSINGFTSSNQPGIVFPSNLTPDQRLQLEINVLQQRLQTLQETQRQQLAQSTPPTQQGLFGSNASRRF